MYSPPTSLDTQHRVTIRSTCGIAEQIVVGECQRLVDHPADVDLPARQADPRERQRGVDAIEVAVRGDERRDRARAWRRRERWIGWPSAAAGGSESGIASRIDSTRRRSRTLGDATGDDGAGGRRACRDQEPPTIPAERHPRWRRVSRCCGPRRVEQPDQQRNADGGADAAMAAQRRPTRLGGAARRARRRGRTRRSR